MIPEKVISHSTYNKVWIGYSLFFVVVWYLANQGLSFWDDFSYLSLANDINTGDFEITTNHFTSRITILYPVAYIIKYLGVNEYTTVFFPLLCGLVLLNLILWLGHSINRWIGVIGGALFICDYHMIYFAGHLFPEMPMALMIFVVLMSYYLVLKGEMVARMAGLLAALALFGAFLTKTTVVLLLPLLLFLFILDRKKRHNGSFWLVFVSLSIFFFLVNGFWYMEVKGSFFYRFQNIADNHVATAKSFFDKGSSAILARLTYLPLMGFLKGGFFIPLILALPAMFKLKKSHFNLEKAEHLWPIASIFLLAAFWFASTSWRYYSPLPTDPRHIVFFIPIFIMTAATFWPETKLFTLLKRKWVSILAVIVVLTIPTYAVSKFGDKNFNEEKYLITEYFVEDPVDQVIITDGLISYGYPFFYDFETTGDQYYWFSEMTKNDVEELINSDKPIYFLTNPANFHEYYNDHTNSTEIWGYFLASRKGEGHPVAQFEEVAISRWFRPEELKEP